MLVSRIASLTTWHKRLRHRASDLRVNVKEIIMQKLLVVVRSEHPQADIFDWTKEEENLMFIRYCPILI